jgi:hypothetical protein
MIKFVRSALIAATLAVASASSYALDWATMTQEQRNNMILGYAASVPTNTTGGQCYPWVKAVAANASGNSTILEGTWAGEKSWWNQNGHVGVVYGDIADTWVKPGMAVQMLIKHASWPNGMPHTFIIGAKDAGGFWMHDSNWVASEKVGHHYITYTDFRSKLYSPSSYSIYYIY